MTPLSCTDNSVHPINEVTHDINPNTISTSWTRQDSDPHTAQNLQQPATQN